MRLLLTAIICSLSRFTLLAQSIATEPNDSILTATPSGLKAGKSGGIVFLANNGDGPHGPLTGSGTGDFDFFSINAKSNQLIMIDVNSNPDRTTEGIDSVIGIYDKFGFLLASNDNDGISLDSLLRYEPTQDGRYYVAVGSWVRGSSGLASNFPRDPKIAGTGKGSPAGEVADYELVLLLDGPAYLNSNRAIFPLVSPTGTSKGSITLTNEGTIPATIKNLYFTGAAADKFSIDQALPLTIPGEAQATIDLDFSPSGSTEILDAILHIESNAGIKPNFSIPVAAKATSGLVFRLPFDDPEDAPTGSFGIPVETAEKGFMAAIIARDNDHPIAMGRPSIAGRTGASAELNPRSSSNNYLVTNTSFPNPASFTYSFWIRPGDLSRKNTLFDRPGVRSFDAPIYQCSINANGAISFQIEGVEVVSSPAGVIDKGQVRHLTVTHFDSGGFDDSSADRTRIYLDGSMVAESVETKEIPQYPEPGNNSRLWIASRSTPGTSYVGNIDDFQFYNLELSAEQVRNLFSNPGSTAKIQSPKKPTIMSFAPTRNGMYEISFTSSPGRSYRLESTSDLKNWSKTMTGILATGSLTKTEIDQTEQLPRTRFFRISED